MHSMMPLQLKPTTWVVKLLRQCKSKIDRKLQPQAVQCRQAPPLPEGRDQGTDGFSAVFRRGLVVETKSSPPVQPTSGGWQGSKQQVAFVASYTQEGAPRRAAVSPHPMKADKECRRPRGAGYGESEGAQLLLQSCREQVEGELQQLQSWTVAGFCLVLVLLLLLLLLAQMDAVGAERPVGACFFPMIPACTSAITGTALKGCRVPLPTSCQLSPAHEVAHHRSTAGETAAASSNHLVLGPAQVSVLAAQQGITAAATTIRCWMNCLCPLAKFLPPKLATMTFDAALSTKVRLLMLLLWCPQSTVLNNLLAPLSALVLFAPWVYQTFVWIWYEFAAGTHGRQQTRYLFLPLLNPPVLVFWGACWGAGALPFSSACASFLFPFFLSPASRHPYDMHKHR